MSKNKETRPKESPNRDPQTTSFQYDEFFQNQLSLTDNIKNYLKDAGLSWRFINAGQFRTEGNRHRSKWQPHKFEDVDFSTVLNADGYICRGDLILATRPLDMTAAHKRFLRTRNNAQNAHSRSEAQKMREDFRRAGLESKVKEGYDDNE